MDNTINQQGIFTTPDPAVAKILTLRSDVDWMKVYNYTQIAASSASTGFQFYWQRGMAAGTGIEVQGNAASTATYMLALAAGGFTLIDSSSTTLPARAALTGLTNANPPVITSAGHGLSIGDIVRFSSLNNQTQLGGLDFSVTAVGATFTIGNISMANSTASTAGYWRKIPFDSLYYPRRRAITFVSSATDTTHAKVYMSVTHGFTVGQKVRLEFPGGSGVWKNFAQLDGTLCTVLEVGVASAGAEPDNGVVVANNNIVVDVDVSGLGDWNVFGGGTECYPATGVVPFTPAQVVPVGDDTVVALAGSYSGLEDATYNTGYIGMQLGAGADAPAGQANDVIYWVAGKSFSV